MTDARPIPIPGELSSQVRRFQREPHRDVGWGGGRLHQDVLDTGWPSSETMGSAVAGNALPNPNMSPRGGGARWVGTPPGRAAGFRASGPP